MAQSKGGAGPSRWSAPLAAALVGGVIPVLWVAAGTRLGELTQGALQSFALALTAPGVPLGFLLSMLVGLPLDWLGVRLSGGALLAASVVACNAGCFAWTAWMLQRGPRSRRIVVLVAWAVWATLAAAWLSRAGSE